MTLRRLTFNLTTTQRRHARQAALGIALSWTVAALMACSTPPKSTALYQELGGPQGITAFSDRAIDRIVADSRGKRSFDGVNMNELKKSIANYICSVADGPCHYEGESMAKAHAETNISGSEFDLLVTMMREEMDRSNVPTAAKNELLRRLAPSRRDIVTH
jgi:hemoglobin